MEKILIDSLNSIGVAGIGFIFLYIVMNKYFKQMEQIIVEIKILCNEFKDLAESFNSLKEVQARQQEIDRNLTEDIKDSYIKISAKIEAQNAKVDQIHIMCNELCNIKKYV